MSQNIEQIYNTNPASSMQSTDLLYLGRSPYGSTSDYAITWSNMQNSITGLGVISGGTWSGNVIGSAYGGTGVDNGSSTITIGGNLTLSGAYTFTGTLSANTSVTFPTSGTLATTSQIMTWVSATVGSYNATVNTGYYVTSASQVNFTLPSTAAAGSVISIVGKGAGGWILYPASGQTIQLINASASTSVASAEQYDAITVVCVVANTTWVATQIATTGFTYS